MAKVKEVIKGAVKGAAVATPISVSYSLADNPSGGLMTTLVAGSLGAIHAATKYHMLSDDQFGPLKYSDAEMAKYNQWYEEAGK